MESNFTLSDSDWSLLLDLLQREQRQLMVEIRHTHAAAYRDQLRSRLHDVEQLLDRIAVPVS